MNIKRIPHTPTALGKRKFTNTPDGIAGASSICPLVVDGTIPDEEFEHCELGGCCEAMKDMCIECIHNANPEHKVGK